MSDWKRSYECVSIDGGAAYFGSDESPVDKAMENGVVWRNDGTYGNGDAVFLLLCTSPEFRHFEETGWLHVWSWRGTAADLVREGIEISGFVGRFTGHEPGNVLEVFDKREGYSRPVTDRWTVKNGVVLRNGRTVPDETVVKKLGWILRRMSRSNGKREYTMVRKSESMADFLNGMEG